MLILKNNENTGPFKVLTKILLFCSVLWQLSPFLYSVDNKPGYKLELFVNQPNQQDLQKKTNLIVNENQPFLLTISLSGANVDSRALQKLNIEGIQEFDVSIRSQGKSLSVVNGKEIESYEFHYFLQPKNIGNFTIGPAKTQINQKQLQSNSVTVSVQQDNEMKDFFATSKLVLSPKQCDEELDSLYVGQKAFIMLTAYLNKQTFDSIEDLMITPPESQEVEIGQPLPAQPSLDERRGNKVYHVMRHFVPVVALQPGKAVLLPFKVLCHVARRSGGSGWDVFFFRSIHDITCATDDGKPKTVDITAVPDNAQAVGSNFSLSAKLNKSRFNLGEPVVLTLTLSGSGDFDKIVHPDLDLPDNLRCYKSNFNLVSPSKKELSQGIETVKQFEYILQLSQDGLYKIPEQTFCYFDSETGQVKNVRSAELNFCVLPDQNETTPQTKPIINPLALPTSPKLPPAAVSENFERMQKFGLAAGYVLGAATARHFSWWLLLAILLLLLIALFFKELRTWFDVKFRQRLALLRAKRALKKAQSRNDARAIYYVMIEFLAQRFDLPQVSLDAQIVWEQLQLVVENKKQLQDFMAFFQQAAALAFGAEKFMLQHHELKAFFAQAVVWLMVVDAAYKDSLRKSK